MAKNDENKNNESAQTLEPGKAFTDLVTVDKDVYNSMLLGLASAAGKNIPTMNDKGKTRRTIVDNYSGRAWNETEEVSIPLDSKNMDDLFVSVNGRRVNIQRGETVRVPKAVAEVIKTSEQQDQRVARLISKLARSSKIL